MTLNTETMFSSKTGEWSTPQDFYDELNWEFSFLMDPCATHENHKCVEYYTEEEDGLAYENEWYGTTFMNPPYGRDIKHWVRKAYEQSKHNIIVGLLPARTDTRWFHDYIYGKAEIRFIKGRLKFGGHKNPAPFPSMVVIWRPDEEELG